MKWVVTREINLSSQTCLKGRQKTFELPIKMKILINKDALIKKYNIQIVLWKSSINLKRKTSAI